jgi:hypothetical protein
MKSKLEKWINRVEIDKTFNYTTTNYDIRLKFYGDGEGDFEESSFCIDKDLVIKYIDYCEEQIKLAKEYIGEEEMILPLMKPEDIIRLSALSMKGVFPNNEKSEEKDWFKFNMSTGKLDE